MNLYPIYIIQDRYGGSYSDGEWIAISEAYNNLEEVENGTHGNDVTARSYGYDIKNKKYVAVGNTPDEALRNLQNKNQP